MRILSALGRLRHQLAFRLLILSALAIAALLPARLLELEQLREHAAEDGLSAVSQIADGGIARLREIVDESKAILMVTALLPAFASPNVPNCHRILTPIVSETAWINSFSSVNADGIVACSSNSAAEGMFIGDRPFLRTALAQKGFQLSGLTRSRTTNKPVLLAAFPIEVPQASSVALVMSINASWFSAIAGQVAHSAPGGLALIVDADGNILGRAGQDASEADVPNSTLLDAVTTLDRESAHAVALEDGRTLVLGVREIPHSSSLLIIGVPQSELDRHTLAAERTIIQDLAIPIALIVLIYWLGHESLVRPAQALAGAAAQLGQGRFDIDIRSAGWASEFKVLAGAIDDAAANLASRAQAEAAIHANLRLQSEEDPLTGLKNRRGLDDFVAHAWANCAATGVPFAAIAFDIDFFKAYNDGYGHAAGDEVLRAVARIMRSQAVNVDGASARTGGEEFTIVAPGATEAEALALAQAVSLRITALQITHKGSPLGLLTASAGVASMIATDGTSAPEVFRAADRALYGAKGAGRNAISRASTITPAHPAPPSGDSVAARPGSSPDTRDRAPQASPSAMSR